MGHPPAILVSPEQMTHRTRAYLFADATRHALCGVALRLPRSFNPIAYERLFTIVELTFVSSARVPQGTPAHTWAFVLSPVLCQGLSRQFFVT